MLATTQEGILSIHIWSIPPVSPPSWLENLSLEQLGMFFGILQAHKEGLHVDPMLYHDFPQEGIDYVNQQHNRHAAFLQQKVRSIDSRNYKENPEAYNTILQEYARFITQDEHILKLLSDAQYRSTINATVAALPPQAQRLLLQNIQNRTGITSFIAPLRTFSDSGSITAIGWHPQKQDTLAWTTSYGGITIQNLSTKQPTLLTAFQPLHAFIWSQTGAKFLTGGSSNLTIWDSSTFRATPILEKPITSLSLQNRRVAFGSEDEVWVIDISSTNTPQIMLKVPVMQQ